MKKFIANAWNIFEIGYISAWGVVGAHMAKVLTQQVANPPADPAAILFTIKQAAFIMFYGSVGQVVIKGIDSPLQRALADWAGQPPKETVSKPLTPPAAPATIAPQTEQQQKAP